MAPEEDPHRGSPPPGAPDDALVPDDISELADDIAAYRREQRAEARRAARARRRARAPRALRWLFPSGRPPQPGFSGQHHPVLLPLGLTAGALALSGLVTVLLTLLAPSRQAVLGRAAPLASTTVAPGRADGLLPVGDVFDAAGSPVSLRDERLRPAVVIIHPAGCDCTDELNQLVEDVTGAGVRAVVVTHEPVSAATPADIQQLNGTVAAYDDPDGTLAGGLRPRVDPDRLAAVILATDGRIDVSLSGSALTSSALETDLQYAYLGQ